MYISLQAPVPRYQAAIHDNLLRDHSCNLKLLEVESKKQHSFLALYPRSTVLGKKSSLILILTDFNFFCSSQIMTWSLCY